MPFEIHEMRAKPDGFELTFTKPVDPKTAGDVESYKMKTYTYIYQADYGSPEVDQTDADDHEGRGRQGRQERAAATSTGLQEGHVHELTRPGVRSADGPAAAAPAGVLHAELHSREVASAFPTAPKGRITIAQGNALGKVRRYAPIRALKGRNKTGCAYAALSGLGLA